MAHNHFQLNYDEATSIAKKFKDEGEDIARLHSVTRQRVRDLYKEWIGEGADKFFEEMETKLLPALQRLSLALFHTQDVTNEIMKIIRNADEEASNYFKDQGAGDDFGAGKFGDALNGLGGIQGPDDFGAGKFGDAAGGQPTGDSSSDDFGANKFGEALGGDNSGAGDQGTGQQHDADSPQGGGKDQKQKDAQTDTKSVTGGGGSGSPSQGLKGNLKEMGAGLGSVAPQNAETGGGGGAGGPTNMPDHVYSDDGSSDSGGIGPQPAGPGGGSSSDNQPAAGAGGAAAGAAGAAAAGAGAAKAIRGKKKKISGE